MPDLATHGLLLALSLAAVSAWGQDSESDRDRGEERRDFSHAHDPRELHEDAEKAFRRKRLLGPVGIGEFHIFPARETGPYPGPPLRIWGNGFGTSLWRDPVTGWPLH